MARPKNTNKRIDKRKPPRKKRRPPIRLACAGCDREDYDGVWRIPKNWEGVQRHQTLTQSYEVVEETDTHKSQFDWFTHLGTCPDCQEADGRTA